MNFLQINDKVFLVYGVANKKSVAWAIANTLETAGAKVVYLVRSQERKDFLMEQKPDADVYLCDVEKASQIESSATEIKNKYPEIQGICHSIAFANYEDGVKPFHETKRKDFLQAIDISCFSLLAICNEFKEHLALDGSVITISISTTTEASENYGYMAPVKAALDSSFVFLAKSFSGFSNIRFNAVCAGLLKTSASAGIPDYVDNYLYAEKCTLRKKALETQEVADAAVFLLSNRSSGINAQKMVLDAGMSVNHFDQEVVKKVMNSKDSS